MSPTRRGLILASMVPALGAGTALAESAWPDRVIRFVVGYPAGQSVDIFARRLAALMGKDLGQTIIVDNRAGANGIVGAQDVSNTKPDGYTLLFGTSGQLTINPSLYKKLPYDTLKSFTPVGLAITGTLFLLANPSFGPNGLQELIAYAKTQPPGSINYGSGGVGITAHLAMELLQATAGIKLTHIPYKGSPAAMQGVMSGQVNLAMDAGGSALPLVKAGKLKVLGTTGLSRGAALPDVPTIAEQGFPGFEIVAWDGILAPAGMSPAIVDRLNASLRRACTDPALIDAMELVGMTAATGTPEAYARFLSEEIIKWRKAVAQADVQLD